MTTHRMFVLAAALLAGACATASSDTASTDTEATSAVGADLDAEIALKQGEEVRQICFVQNIGEWRPLGARSLVVREGANDWYRVTLAGVCDARRAVRSIGFGAGPSGSSCLRRGDAVAIFDAPTSGSCRVREIFAWDEDAEPPA